MGNFSRNTFDPTRNYVGVRLQQGVPLLDADWNEMDDAIRNEIYSGLGQLFPDGAPVGTQDLQISPGSPAQNNLSMAAGMALVGGRPVRVRTPITYTAQPWFNNPTQAAQDGVAVIPPLTVPTGTTFRSDLVYLDIWDREVRSTEDTNLINPVIGVETCVRLKREFALRVAEGGSLNSVAPLPATPAGHFFMPLAVLFRSATVGANISPSSIMDMRPRLFNTRGPRSLAVVPTIFPFLTLANTWSFDIDTNSAKCSAAFGSGYLPLQLPEGATLLSMRVQGNSGGISFIMYAKIAGPHVGNEVLNAAFTVAGGIVTEFDTVFAIPTANRQNIIDNNRFSYCLFITNGQKPTALNRITINYQY